MFKLSIYLPNFILKIEYAKGITCTLALMNTLGWSYAIRKGKFSKFP